MRLRFCGAARTVTGSCHLVQTDGGLNLLLDCGLFQGRQAYIDDWNMRFAFVPKEIDAVILSHAHIDHAGRIPKLVKEGFRGPIYCTPATHALVAPLLLDCAHIQQKDSEYHNKHRKRQGLPPLDPLYTPNDVHRCLQMFQTVPYENWFSLNSKVRFQFRDAGHILGSATVSIETDGPHGLRLGFTGDVGRPDRPILRDPNPMLPCDILISESTYGDKLHPDRHREEAMLWEIVYDTCFQRLGKLLIPAFSLGRTQEILYLLNRLDQQKLLRHLPVFLDSPLSVDITAIYRKHLDCFDDEIRQLLLTDPNPFGFPQLTFITDVEQSKQLNDYPGPAIIISASGMAEAGRIVHHIKNNIEDERCTILFVGHCAEGTLGWRLRQGINPVRVLGQHKTVKARIAALDGFSAHADQLELMQFLKPLLTSGLKQLFLVHGTYESQIALQQLLQPVCGDIISIPDFGQEVVV
ncbi:MAG: MBL fold metallo-hydrolase [Chitinophagales bacterium]|nr:MBL fold metallo-hydrolase [Chitinophagales bacterium]MDW8428441.1 MBL fold metallo-hydrolase [Chitinophagales bacterium]